MCDLCFFFIISNDEDDLYFIAKYFAEVQEFYLLCSKIKQDTLYVLLYLSSIKVQVVERFMYQQNKIPGIVENRDSYY